MEKLRLTFKVNEEPITHWESVPYIVGKGPPYTGGQRQMVHIILVITGKSTLYIGGQWEERSLHWRSVEIIHLTLVDS